MKKIFLSTMAAVLMTITAKTQTIATSPVGGIGIRAGVNFQNINGKDEMGNDLEFDMMTGFHAGLTADVPIGTGFILQPGVIYSMKGAELSDDVKLKLNYIEIPINFIYKPALGSGSMLLGFGPYVAFGIGGKIEGPGGEIDVDFVSDYEPGNANPQFKRIDAGGNLLAGYEFANKLSFQLNAQLGLMSINPDFGDVNNETSFKNTGFGISLGYRF